MGEQASSGRRAFACAVLLVGSLPLIRHARRVAKLPIGSVVATVGPLTAPRTMAIPDVELVARLGVRWWSRLLGGPDTSLVRSIGVAALLRSRGRTAVVIGLIAGEASPTPQSPAWPVLNGRPVGLDGLQAEKDFESTVDMPIPPA